MTDDPRTERCCWDASASGCPFHGPTTPPGVDTRAEALAAAVLAEHVRGDWSDRTYNCSGCARRFEQEGQARFDALGREATREELIEFRGEYGKVSHPGWTLAEYNAHVAQVLAASLAQTQPKAHVSDGHLDGSKCDG